MPATAWADPPGLVASYSFDEGSGLSAGDSSGNGHAGTITGATWATGRYGGGLDFNGTNASVDLGGARHLLPVRLHARGLGPEAERDQERRRDRRHLERRRRTDALGRPHRDPLPPDHGQRDRELPRLRPQPDRRAMATPGRHLRRHHRPLLHRRHRSRQPPRHRRHRQLQQLANRRLRQQPRRLLRRPDRQRPHLQPQPHPRRDHHRHEPARRPREPRCTDAAREASR